MIRLAVPLFFLLLSAKVLASSQIIKYKIQGKQSHRFTLEESCQLLKSHSAPLAEALNAQEIDCMTEKIKISDFCSKKYPLNEYLVRSYIDMKSNQAVCDFGNKVLLELKDSFSQIALEECKRVRHLFATRLPLKEADFLDKSGQKVLRCVFSSPIFNPL